MGSGNSTIFLASALLYRHIACTARIIIKCCCKDGYTCTYAIKSKVHPNSGIDAKLQICDVNLVAPSA